MSIQEGTKLSAQNEWANKSKIASTWSANNGVATCCRMHPPPPLKVNTIILLG